MGGEGQLSCVTPRAWHCPRDASTGKLCGFDSHHPDGDQEEGSVLPPPDELVPVASRGAGSVRTSWPRGLKRTTQSADFNDWKLLPLRG